MRIVGGHLRGRALATPKDAKVRPTSDRVREALFNILEHGLVDFEVRGAHVLDLFAGTGALGIEALSRGAQTVIFVDDAVASRALIQSNLDAFGLAGISTIFRRSATDLGANQKRTRARLVFADPPYGKGLAEQAITSAIKGDWLDDGAIIVVEEARNAVFSWPDGTEQIDERRYGATKIMIGRYQEGAAGPAP